MKSEATKTTRKRRPARTKPLPSVAEQQLTSIIETTNDAIFSRNLEGEILTWNGGAERLFGYKPKEIIGQPVTVLAPDDHPLSIEEVSEAMRRGDRIENHITTRKRKDGTLVIVSLTISPLKDEAGQVIGVGTIAHDITAKETLIRRQREFVSIASHELRTPLTALTGYLSLAENAEDTKQAKEFIDRAFRASRRLTELVEDLLQVARLEDDRVVFELERIAPDTVINEVIEELEPTIRGKRLKLTVTSGITGRDKITVDRVKFRQVIWNLLDNAIKYTPVGGRITVLTKANKQSISICIRDTGVGIDVDNIERVFQKFFREYTEASLTAGGTGLGLFITKELVERQGGALTISSRRNRGTSALIRFPRRVKRAVRNRGTMPKKT